MIAHIMVNMITYKEIKNDNMIAHIMANHTKMTWYDSYHKSKPYIDDLVSCWNVWKGCFDAHEQHPCSSLTMESYVVLVYAFKSCTSIMTFMTSLLD